jgi:hypothetical protein|nr:MAG TPA: hypothetical protein [Caudoviricetes sp.]
MTILVKGPYSRKDYINNIQNIENQQDDINTRMERINDNAIMITLVVALLYCIGVGTYLFSNRYEFDDAVKPFAIAGFALIFIIALISHHITVRPYNKQKDSLHEEANQLEKHYRDNMVEVPLSEYIDHIKVQGDKVTFPPLDEIDERYLYDEWSHNPSDTDHSIRQIFRLYQDFYEKDRLYTRYTYIWISITREECLMLKAKR